MRIQREDASDEGVINISSLLDVMFILVIFFLATATFDKQETDQAVQLPQSSIAPSTMSAKSKTITINVHADGTYLVNNPILDRLTTMELEGMRQDFKKVLEDNPDVKALVRGDRKAFHGDVAAAVTLLREVGFLEANIGYDYKATESTVAQK